MRKSRWKDEREREVLLVAYDYCVLGLRGERLAKHRHLSAATLARRLQQAKEAGYIREAVLNIPKEALEGVFPYIARWQKSVRLVEIRDQRMTQKTFEIFGLYR